MSDVERCDECGVAFVPDGPAERSRVLEGLCLDCAFQVSVGSLAKQVDADE